MGALGLSLLVSHLLSHLLSLSHLGLILAAGGGFEWPGAADIDAQDLSSLDHSQRQRAAERLALRGGPQPHRELLALLDDPAPSVRLTVARILAREGAPEAIETATHWTISATPTNRRLGLDVLRDAATPLPAAALRAVERSLGDGDVTVRLLAIDTLSRQKELAPSLLAIAAATEDDNREVRLRAVRVLAASRDPRAGVSLLARLGDQDRQVRVEAIHALAALGDVRGAAALKRLLDDPADDVRGAAALALGRLKIADAVPAIATLIRRRPLDDFARQATLALGDLATPEAIAALLERLREPPLADELLAGLLRAGEAAVPALAVEAQRGTPSSSAAAVTLLGRLRAGTRGADPAVTRLLSDLVQRRALVATAASSAAIDALAVIRDPESLPALFDAAGDALAETRRASFRALIAVGDDRALPLVERGLADRDAQVRALALRLGTSLHVTAPAILAAMAVRLGDVDRAVGHEAVTALVKRGRRVPGTVEPLLALLARAPADHALADALEIAATPADDGALVAAARRLPAEARRTIARALAAAHGAQPIESRAVIDWLLELLAIGGVDAEAAGDALVLARPGGGDAAAALHAFDTAEPEVRPHLCAVIAALAGPAGSERLIAIAGAGDSDGDGDGGREPAPLRAAAAWALATTSDLPRDDPGAMARLRLALTRASTSADPATAGNASAALAILARPPPSAPRAWTALRLLAPDGTPLAHEAVSLTATSEGGVTVWANSGLDGALRLRGLPPGPYQVRLVRPAQRARIAR